jgi:hypothetical protein
MEAAPSERIMADVLYVLGTVAFFGLMLLYVRGCDALGRGAVDADEERNQ